MLLPRLLHALDSPSSKFQIVPSHAHDLHKLLHVAEFASAYKLPMFALPMSVTTLVFRNVHLFSQPDLGNTEIVFHIPQEIL
jgi:hypothetical protein